MLRAFRREEALALHKGLEALANAIARKHRVKVQVSDLGFSYVSTAEAIGRHPEHADLAERVMRDHGLQVRRHFARGGTDGAMLNVHYPDLPAPDLGIGVRNCHQKTEFVVVEEMQTMVGVVVEMLQAYAGWSGQTGV